MNTVKSEKKVYVVPQLQELGEHSAVVTTGGVTFTEVDGFLIRDGKAYASFAS